MIGPDAKELLESGCALIVGTVDVNGMPHAARAWGLDVIDGDATRIRVLVAADEPVMLDNLDATGLVAVTGTDIRTLRSIQAKGRVIRVEAATLADRYRADRYCETFMSDIEEVDATPRALTERLRPDRFRACTVAVDELYDQTPGPRAGERVPSTTG